MHRVESLVKMTREIMPDASEDDIIAEVTAVLGKEADPKEISLLVRGIPDPDPNPGDVVIVDYGNKVRDLAVVLGRGQEKKELIEVATEWGERKTGRARSLTVICRSEEWLAAEIDGTANAEFRERMASELWK